MSPAVATLEQVVCDVEDPELPHVTIGDLGIVRSVAIDGVIATVEITPTYTGCPATEQIRDDVADAVVLAGYVADVRTVMSPPWSTDWITERGRERLREAGIAPPPPASSLDDADPPGLTVVDPPAACPRCGSRRSRLISQFGATACKASYVCGSCLEPFELFKPL